MNPDPRNRAEWLPWACWIAGVAWAAVLLLLLWPAWQNRARLAESLAERERDLANQRQVTAAIPAARARLAASQEAILTREAWLAAAGPDSDVIRQVQGLAGDRLVLMALQIGESRPVEPAPAKAGEKKPAAGKQRAAGGQTAGEQADAGQQPHAGDAAPYWQAPMRIEGAGAREELVAFLADLESLVPGLRIEGVQLEVARNGPGEWNLLITASLRMVRTPLKEVAVGM